MSNAARVTILLWKSWFEVNFYARHFAPGSISQSTPRTRSPARHFTPTGNRPLETTALERWLIFMIISIETHLRHCLEPQQGPYRAPKSLLARFSRKEPIWLCYKPEGGFVLRITSLSSIRNNAQLSTQTCHQAKDTLMLLKQHQVD